MQGTQYATKRSILCRGAFCGPTMRTLHNGDYCQIRMGKKIYTTYKTHTRNWSTNKQIVNNGTGLVTSLHEKKGAYQPVHPAGKCHNHRPTNGSGILRNHTYVHWDHS